jgi:hypothetical protein
MLAVLIALSVAMLPAAAGAGSSSPASADMSATDISAIDMPSGNMSATDMAAMDMSDMEGGCCPHKTNPCDQADNCCTMATCALKYFSFAGTAWSTITFPSSFAKLAIAFGEGPLSSQTGSPPFRPPRA